MHNAREEDLVEMASCLTLKKVDALDQIYKIGDNDHNFYIMLRGVVSI